MNKNNSDRAAQFLPSCIGSGCLPVLVVVLLSFPLSACGAPAASTAAPIPSAAPTNTPLPLHQQVSLTSVPLQENDPANVYRITAQTPTLKGSSDPRVQTFNTEMADLVAQFIADFQDKRINLQPPPLPVASTLDVRYTLVSPPGNLLSLKFETEGYISGMAHPYHVSRSVNFDLEQGRDLALAELFLPDSGYLEALSKYCASELGTRDIDFKDFAQGADPTPDNYRNWNITSAGLMITFDEYQVAPYAAGPQVVTVPYNILENILDRNGPAGEIAARR